MTRYVLVYEHENGLDCFLFDYQPSKTRPFPSELALADHFGLDFEPAKDERLTVVSINNVESIPQFTADQIGKRNPCDSLSDGVGVD